ncbi:MBL fold metallo-hydrolase [Clostridium niameyense]|uniref:MBL fold metallo-hydrolase n=1 Tax=Clostridium niameyense TaxID=1622073 RepID=A0A6M0RAZ0_9CLOT|nr:ComEC/Rec2 family competence protein [Clostridium niameyense]NEZ47445.1 MBL fold metallo-hydrolase [Clostridium niameyense]
MKTLKKYISILFVLLITFAFTACASTSVSKESTSNSNNKMLVHYIDVGQGDSELIQLNDKNILIDAGTRKSSDKVVSYLKKQNIKKLDYVIATHPHEDHIGGIPAVLKNFEVDTFYAPKKTANTKIFKDMISELKNKNLKINVAKAGKTLDIGNNAEAKFVAPNNDNYQKTNDYSAVIKITYGSSKFLFTGDAEKLSEKEMLSNHIDISCNVLKAGHHGSHSSSSKEFLDKTNPKTVIISCGKNNDYGHPHKETLKELKKRNIQVYRTDIDGDIILTSDGKNISK